MAKKLYLHVDTILVDMGDHKVRFNRGDELVGVPAGSLDSMIRLRQAVDELPPEEEPVPAPRQVEQAPAPPMAWDQTRIADLDVSNAIKKSMAGGGFSTVAEAIEFGAKHGGLQSIDGMTEAKEKAFQAAVEKLIPKTEG